MAMDWCRTSGSGPIGWSWIIHHSKAGCNARVPSVISSSSGAMPEHGGSRGCSAFAASGTSSGSGISDELGPGRQESLRLLRCLSLDQLLLGAVEGGVVVREEGRKGQGGRAWEQAVGGG